MEYIQAILFTFKYVFGQTGNTDLFYLFSCIVLLFYAWRRRDKFLLILQAAAPVFIVCVLMAFLYPNIDIFRVFVFCGKFLLNITLGIFVAYNSRSWRMTRFVKAVAIILAVETIVAFMMPNSSMWVREKLVDGVADITRLRLFYLNAGALSFAGGFILILLVYQLITEEVVWHQVIGIVVIVIDVYMSYGIGGLAAAFMAVAFMLCMAYIYKFKNITYKSRKKFLIATIVSFTGIICVIATNSIYMGRTKSIVKGTDYIFKTKLLDPMGKLGEVLLQTKFMGVGFGNANTKYALEIMNVSEAYPNSFLRIIAEGGGFGIALVLFVILSLSIVSFKYGNIIDKSLCVYIIVYQFVGGYFTDPTNFLIYGLIIGDCIKNKYELTGYVRLKQFRPIRKEKLYIGQIGHKRIPSREGGVEIVVEELSKRLVARGQKVDAYNRCGHHISGEEFNSVDYGTLEEYEGINIIKIPTIQKKGVAAMVYSLFASVVSATKEYDVVHYHAEGPSAFVWIPSLVGIRTVVTIHGLDWQRTGKWGSLASQFIKFGEKMAVEYADEIIVLSKQVQNYFLATYNRKTNLIPNGVERVEKKEAKLITDKWGLKPNEYILLLARLTSEKGFHYAIEAFKNINTDKKLVVAGGASDTEAYVQKLMNLAQGDSRIIFTGFVQGSELAELYSNAYVYCLPSDLEGMPISLLEAMSYGNCCLVSDIPECTSVIGKYGRTFSQGKIDDLQKELEDLISHPDMVDEYKAKSAEYICKKYKWENVVDETLELYRK